MEQTKYNCINCFLQCLPNKIQRMWGKQEGQFYLPADLNYSIDSRHLGSIESPSVANRWSLKRRRVDKETTKNRRRLRVQRRVKTIGRKKKAENTSAYFSYHPSPLHWPSLREGERAERERGWEWPLWLVCSSETRNTPFIFNKSLHYVHSIVLGKYTLIAVFISSATNHKKKMFEAFRVKI